MNYTIWELSAFFFCYSLLGWCLNICIEALKTGKFKNVGLLQGPISPAYGITMVIITIFLRDAGGDLLTQFLVCVALANMLEFFIMRFSSKLVFRNLRKKRELNLSLSRQHILDFFETHFLMGSWKGLVYALFVGLTAMSAMNLLNPFIYIFCQVIPSILLKVIDIVAAVLLVMDILATLYTLHRLKRESRLLREVSEGLNEASINVGTRIYQTMKRNIYRTYPELGEELSTEEGFGTPVKKKFAEGFSIHKLFWIFFVCSLLGDWIETVYVWAVSGVLMSRSSLLYGTFSIVWGFGATMLTVILQPLFDKDDRYIFIGGFFFGGAYEYMCSVFTEVVFGTVFWDYSHMPLNINGRTNIWFMICWGVLSVVWIKMIYPRLSNLIERIPAVLGLIVTWCLIVFMVLNMAVSGLALIRYMERQDQTQADNAIETFIDTNYPDRLIEFIWPNMKILR